MNAKGWNVDVTLHRKKTLRDLLPGLYRPAPTPGGRAAFMVSPRLLAKHPIEAADPRPLSAVLDALERQRRDLVGATLSAKAPGLRLRVHLKHT